MTDYYIEPHRTPELPPLDHGMTATDTSTCACRSWGRRAHQLIRRHITAVHHAMHIHVHCIGSIWHSSGKSLPLFFPSSPPLSVTTPVHCALTTLYVTVHHDLLRLGSRSHRLPVRYQFYANMRLPHISAFFAYFSKEHVAYFFHIKLAFSTAILIFSVFPLNISIRFRYLDRLIANTMTPSMCPDHCGTRWGCSFWAVPYHISAYFPHIFGVFAVCIFFKMLHKNDVPNQSHYMPSSTLRPSWPATVVISPFTAVGRGPTTRSWLVARSAQHQVQPSR